LDAGKLLVLPADQTTEQARTDSQRHVGSRHSLLDDALKDEVALYNIELRAVEVLAGRFEEPHLEEFDRGGHAE
jgi:hypothetical protein